MLKKGGPFSSFHLKKGITYRYFVSFLNNQEFQQSNIAKFFESFINPSSCYVVVKKCQQVFHITFVINVIIKNLILVGAHKIYKSVHRENIIPQ